MVIDVPAQDIMRGRLNGVPNYHALRKVYFGGPKRDIYRQAECDATEESPAPDPLPCFRLVTGEDDLAVRFQGLYGKVNNIDGIVGLLAEDPASAPGSLVSRTAAVIIGEEYRRKRDADRFFYARQRWTRAERRYLKGRTFLDVVADNVQGGGRVEIRTSEPFGPRIAEVIEQGPPGSMKQADCLRRLDRNSFKVVDFAIDCP